VEDGSGATAFCYGQVGDWVILFSDDFDWADPERVLELSRFGLALGCQFEDKVEMASVACAARDGAELWRVSHVNDPWDRLDVSGEPPAALAAIRGEFFRKQEEDGGEKSGVDYVHEIPLELAKSVCGYRADEDESVFMGLKLIGAPAGADSRVARPPVAAGPPLSFLDKLLAPFKPRRY